MRSINHLRSRANTGSAVLRIRHSAGEGLQKFFAVKKNNAFFFLCSKNKIKINQS